MDNLGADGYWPGDTPKTENGNMTEPQPKPKPDIYSNPNLEGELHQFLLRNPQLAQELATRTRDLGPKESMAVIAKAMWESQWSDGKPGGRQPGQWNCLCGKVISRNKKYCRECQNREAQL
jgi:hypothetical protein